MVRVLLDIKKSVEDNASVYFEKAKKAKKKLKGAEAALERAKARREVILKKQAEELEKESRKEEKVKRKEEWYEKFRWFISSEGFLVVGGRDATSNEMLIKKHTEKDDLVFHTDMAGSPFFVIKARSKGTKGTAGNSTVDSIGQQTLQEVADATCSYSRAWKLGLVTTDVFYVKPEQVTKEANPGEYLPKGAFMIKGKTTYVQSKINLAVGITKDGRIMGGPHSAVKKNCEKLVVLEPGKEKTSATAKSIRSKIGGDLDEIIRAMPAGGAKIKK